MSIAASVVSAVLGSVISNTVGDGLAGNLLNLFADEASQNSIEGIHAFINSGKNRMKSALSDSSMRRAGIPGEKIEYVAAEVKDLLSAVEITDEVLGKCDYEGSKLQDFLWQEYKKSNGSQIEQDGDVKKALGLAAKVLSGLALESENFEHSCLKGIRASVNDISAGLQKISKFSEENFMGLNENSRETLQILKAILEQLERRPAVLQENKKSRTRAYRDKWDSNMFLNNFDRHDEPEKVSMKLSDVYLEAHLPHYIWGENKRVFSDLKELLSEYIHEDRENKMLLVLGQPGIGKSTLITWVTANFADCVNDILVYKFASDLKQIEWEKDDAAVFWEILAALDLEESCLEGKTLILDGFDEVDAGNFRKEVLDAIYGSIAYGLKVRGFSLIITCRENYIQGYANVLCKYLILQPWDEAQIRSFCGTYQRKTNTAISESTIENVVANQEILGIPLILYMVLALGIEIEREGSIVDVYDKIFSLEQGIYDRCIENRDFEDSHRVSAIKGEIHQVSRDIAMWMFENNPGEASVPKGQYLDICKKIAQGRQTQPDIFISQDLLIGSYFKVARHCEGLGATVSFVHRSIYEYFVAETIFHSIESAMRELSDESRCKFAANIALYLKTGSLTVTICQYLGRKILKLRSGLPEPKKARFYKWWEGAVGKMMDKGMFYYCDSLSRLKNLIFMEVRCFVNLTILLRSILDMQGDIRRYKYIMHNVNRESLEIYIRYCALVHFIWRGQRIYEKLDLRKMYLRDLDLHAIDLREANLSGACLSGADLTDADLTLTDCQGAVFEEADLRNADFRGANLRNANLRGADLRGTVLESFNKTNQQYTKVRGQNLKGANLKGACLNHSIWWKKDVQRVGQLNKATFSCLILDRKDGPKLERDKIWT